MINELKRKFKEVYGENTKAEDCFKFNFKLTEEEKEELKCFSANRKIYFIIDYIARNTDCIELNEFLFEYGYTYFYDWLHELDEEFIYKNWFELREFFFDMIVHDHENKNLIYPNYKKEC